MTRAEIITLQRELNARGASLTVDGIYGPKTAKYYQMWLDTRDDSLTPAPPAAKPWWTSRAILGLLATVLAMLAGHFGLEIDGATITPILLQVVELGGLVVAAWGTVTRKAPIDNSLVARVNGQSVRLPSAHPLPADGPPDQPSGPFGY